MTLMHVEEVNTFNSSVYSMHLGSNIELQWDEILFYIIWLIKEIKLRVSYATYKGILQCKGPGLKVLTTG